jgi:2-polyprenyl-3-methyl-5-hydroxy-6-metoxy-1,4-benzoquinol methylase
MKNSSVGQLIGHTEVKQPADCGFSSYKTLLPTQLPVITYPYEWCFSQLKDAALLTLAIQRNALAHGMWLKDANAFNIQFLDGRPVLIDTLSFEKYMEGARIGYRQFCESFFAPLCLISYVHEFHQKTLVAFPDGIPLSYASASLPRRTFFKLPVFMHIHLQRSLSAYAASKSQAKSRKSLSKSGLQRIIDSLESAIRNLKWTDREGRWAGYYSTCSYSKTALEQKKEVVRRFLEEARPNSVCDLGANTGEFSFMAAASGARTLALDSEPACVELIYNRLRRERITNLWPIQCDLIAPSPSIGWDNEERPRILERCRSDMVMALALIHHLSLAKNVPLAKVASLLAKIGSFAIVEFVPKNDPQSVEMLRERADAFPDYTQQAFENDFGRFFEIESSVPIQDTMRTLYLMKRRA